MAFTARFFHLTAFQSGLQRPFGDVNKDNTAEVKRRHFEIQIKKKKKQVRNIFLSGLWCSAVL